MPTHWVRSQDHVFRNRMSEGRFFSRGVLANNLYRSRLAESIWRKNVLLDVICEGDGRKKREEEAFLPFSPRIIPHFSIQLAGAASEKLWTLIAQSVFLSSLLPFFFSLSFNHHQPIVSIQSSIRYAYHCICYRWSRVEPVGWTNPFAVLKFCCYVVIRPSGEVFILTRIVCSACLPCLWCLGALLLGLPAVPPAGYQRKYTVSISSPTYHIPCL